MSAAPAPFPLERDHRLSHGRGELTLGVLPGDVQVLRGEVYGVPHHGYRTEVWLWRRGDLWRLAVAVVDETGRLHTLREGWYDDEARALWSHGQEVTAMWAERDRLYPGAAAVVAELVAARAGYREDRDEAG